MEDPFALSSYIWPDADSNRQPNVLDIDWNNPLNRDCLAIQNGLVAYTPYWGKQIFVGNYAEKVTPDGNGVFINGGNDYAAINTGYSLSSTDGFTLDVLLYGTAYPNLSFIAGLIVASGALAGGSVGDQGKYRSLLAYQGSTPANIHSWQNGTSYDAASGVAFAAGRQHVVITKDKGSNLVKIYRNGVFIYSRTITTPGVSGTYYQIGGRHNSGTVSFTGTVLVSSFLRRGIDANEVLERYNNPWAIMTPGNHLSFATPSTGETDLLGAASSNANATGAITSVIPITGASASVASATGAVSSIIPLAGSSASVSTASGNIEVSISLTGSAIAAAIATGQLNQAAGLDGIAPAITTGAADLTAASPLNGAASSVSAGSGAISVTVDLSGSALVQALATGDLISELPGASLSGSASGQVSAGGEVLQNIPLTGSGSANTVSSAGLYQNIPLIGEATGYAISHGDLGFIIPILGAAAGVTSVSGNATITYQLSEQAIAEALAYGNITINLTMSGSAAAQAIANANLSGGLPWSGVLAAKYTLTPGARDYQLIPTNRNYTLEASL